VSATDRQSDPAEPLGVCLPKPTAPLISVTVAATTVLGLDNEPATLHGPADPIPMPAELARELAFGPRARRWRRILYDPSTGIATDVRDGYRPPGRMDAFVRARDGHLSRMPTSTVTRLELDHVRPYDHPHPAGGGATAANNLASLGKRDHQLKTDGVLRVVGDANGRLEFFGRSGRRYPSDPHLYAVPTEAERRQDMGHGHPPY
jgi:hypothetical protein